MTGVRIPGGLLEALRLIVILDAEAAEGSDPAGLAREAVRGGATMLQVRGKALSADELARMTRRVLEAAGGVPVTVNDRLDVALAVGAAGCHLGQDDFPIAEARLLTPPGFLLGGSAGSEDEARRAASQGAHYLGIGPIRVTSSKADAGQAIGVTGFARIRAAAPSVPAVGIGGVTAAMAPALVAAGAAGVAVIAAVVGTPDPYRAARELRDALGR
ncbi:MAG: thiamine phosphate synthase [Gemmatimonadetes bacterium]|nr:thiamine phosphate synthase [Gemmatimonadota bacterium]